jgi:hypothetical protein
MLYIVDGRPMDAVYRGHEGEAAIYAIIDWREGRFQFSPRLPDRPQRIFTSAQGLLLEAMRRFDEQEQAVTSLPSDPEVRLYLASEPKPSQFPPESTLADFQRLREVLDGRSLREVLEHLKGRLETVQLLVALYEHGCVKEATGGLHETPLFDLSKPPQPEAVSFAPIGSGVFADESPFELPPGAYDRPQANPFGSDATPITPAAPAPFAPPVPMRPSPAIPPTSSTSGSQPPAPSLDDQVLRIKESMPDFER